VLARLAGEDGTLLHAWRAGRAHVSALLDDYAFLVSGLLRLRAATGEGRWLREAERLAAEQDRRLGDSEAGGWFAAGEDPRLLFRAKPAFDGAVASGNGVAVLNLLELEALLGGGACRGRAEAALRAFGEGMEREPLAHVTLVRALARLDVGRPAVARAAAPSPDEALEAEAREVVEIEGRLGRGEEDGWRPFVLELHVRKGWHLNANPATRPGLVPTSVAPVLGSLRALRYPEGEPLGSPAAPVAVYRGVVRVEGQVDHRGAGAPTVELTYQACDESRCLPPVTRLVRLH
jgi:hypothetical protein